MQGLRWQFVVVFALVLGTALGALAMGHEELASMLGAAAAGLLGPARRSRDGGPRKEHRRWPEGVGGALCALLVAGCGAGQTVAETSRVAACEAAEERIERQHAGGELEYQAARRRLGCVREVCDELYRRMSE